VDTAIEGARRGTNLPRMGDFNQSVILDAVRRSPDGCSRVELVAATGLSAQTVSNISRRLLDTGLIVEAGKASVGPGKPRTLLRLNPTGMYAAGVHIDPAVLTCVLLDLTGRVVEHSVRPTPLTQDPEQVVATLQRELESVITRSAVPRAKIVGIGIAAPGPVDLDQGTVIDPPLMLGWHRVPLRDWLARVTGMPVLVDKDVTAAAVAEAWAGGETGAGSFVFYYLGTGIGAGLVLRDEVQRGSSGNAGEIGHIIVDPAGPACTCGARGCVAVTCTPQALVAEAERHGILPDTRLSSTASDVAAQFRRLCDLADDGSLVAREIIDRSAVRTARVLSTLTNMLDVDRVVIGGPYWRRLSPHYLARVPELLGELSVTRSIRTVAVSGTSVGDDVGAIGAACLVLERTLAPSPTRLLLEH
jgi:predicted NBD/HSP70 family sugar kinase